MKVLDAYQSGFTYETNSFKDAVHKTHRRIDDKSKY